MLKISTGELLLCAFFRPVVVNSDRSLTFVPKTSRLCKYSKRLNMALRELLLSKSTVKQLNWKTNHRVWGNLFNCVCKQGLQNRKDMVILHTLLVRRYV